MLILLWGNVKATHDAEKSLKICIRSDMCTCEREILPESINIAFLCLMDVWHIFMFPQQIPLSYFLFCQWSSKQQILTIIPEKLLIKTTLFCLLLSSITHWILHQPFFFLQLHLYLIPALHIATLIGSNAKITFTKCLCHLYLTHFVMCVCWCWCCRRGIVVRPPSVL